LCQNANISQRWAPAGTVDRVLLSHSGSLDAIIPTVAALENAVHRMLQEFIRPRALAPRVSPLRMVGGPAAASSASAGSNRADASAGPPPADETAVPASSDAPGEEAGRQRERALLDAWREAHWALRLRLRDLMGMGGASEVERLYDLARRADNQLNDFYRSRAEELTRRLRDVLVDQTPPSPTHGDRPTPRFTPQTSSVLATITSATPLPPVDRPGASTAKAPEQSPGADVTINERALLNRFRVMDGEDRAALLRVAQRFAESTPRSR
jgi:hypothetical protein